MMAGRLSYDSMAEGHGHGRHRRRQSLGADGESNDDSLWRGQLSLVLDLCRVYV